MRQTFEILKKDMLSEMRSRYVINSLLMFVIVVISVLKFSIGDEKVSVEILSGLLWIAIFFSASSGLARVFIKEEEKETSFALKLSSEPTQIFIGKLLFNLFLVFTLNIFIFLLFVAITGFEIKNLEGFFLILTDAGISSVFQRSDPAIKIGFVYETMHRTATRRL